MRAIGGDDETRAYRLDFAVFTLHRQDRGVHTDVDRAHARRHAQQQARILLEPAPEGGAERAVGDYVAEGLDALLPGVQTREAKAAGLGDVDRTNGLGLACDRLPDAQRAVDAPAGVAQGCGARVEVAVGLA